MAIQPPTDAPFGLQPNIAAGLAWVFGIIGGLIMLFGGGTNRFVKNAAAQSVTLWGAYFVFVVAFNIIVGITHLWVLLPLTALLGLAMMVVWVVTSIMGFQGKDIELPIVGNLSKSLFKTQLV